MSTRTSNEREAIQFLETRLAEVNSGTFVPPEDRRTTMEDLYKLLVEEYRENSQHVETVQYRWKHLAPFFAHVPATSVTTAQVKGYRRARLEAKAAVATVNREVAALKRMLTIGWEDRLLRSVPYLPLAAEDNVRTGFLTPEKRQMLGAHFREEGLTWMVALLELGRKFGWRRSNWLSRQVRHVESRGDHGMIRMEPGETKNKMGIEAVVSGQAWDLLKGLVRGKTEDDYLFTYRNGRPVRDFRYRWQKGCCAVGLGRMLCPQCYRTDGKEVVVHDNGTCSRCHSYFRPNHRLYRGLLFHDLRRTAARDAIRAGIPENVVMKIVGHQTRAMLDRYDIVSDVDLQDAARKLDQADENDTVRKSAQMLEQVSKVSAHSVHIRTDSGQPMRQRQPRHHPLNTSRINRK